MVYVRSTYISYMSFMTYMRIWHLSFGMYIYFNMGVRNAANHIRYPTTKLIGTTAEIFCFLIFPLYFSEFPSYILRVWGSTSRPPRNLKFWVLLSIPYMNDFCVFRTLLMHMYVWFPFMLLTIIQMKCLGNQHVTLSITMTARWNSTCTRLGALSIFWMKKIRYILTRSKGSLVHFRQQCGKFV